MTNATMTRREAERLWTERNNRGYGFDPADELAEDHGEDVAAVVAGKGGVEGYCDDCGWPIAAEGWTLTGEDAAPREGARPQRCQDTACTC